MTPVLGSGGRAQGIRALRSKTGTRQRCRGRLLLGRWDALRRSRSRHRIDRVDACCPTKGVLMADQPADHVGRREKPPQRSTTARFGTHTIRFETGRLAKQAAGSVVAYLDDDTVLLSATTAGKSPARPVRLLPADRRRRRADVRRRPHPRLVLPPRRPPERGRDPHLPADRPPAAPDLHQGPAQRGPGRHHGPGAQPRPPLRRARDQRGVGVDPDLGPAVQRPDRRHPGRPHRGPVGRVPEPQPARAGHLRHGRRRPACSTPATSRS